MIIKLFLWHWFEAPYGLFKVWSNIVWFIYHFFGIEFHTRTLFSPWHSVIVQADYQESPIKAFFYNISSSIISRFLGAIVRFITIFSGLIIILFSVIFGFILILAWIVAPFFLAYLFYIGFNIML